MLLRSTDDLIGTGLPKPKNVIMADRICMFLAKKPFAHGYDHYLLLVVDYYGHTIIDDVLATENEFKRWFEPVHNSSKAR